MFLRKRGYVMQADKKTGFVGAGNMATALIKGLIESGVYPPDRLVASDKDRGKLKRLQSEYGIKGADSNAEMIRECSIVLLCVKPQNMREVLKEIKEVIHKDHLIISIAAGIPLGMIGGVLGPGLPLIRVMPNTPALVQQGVSALARGDHATPEHMEEARRIFGAVGDTVDVKEELMDAVTALSGSGPGYVFRIMECMVNAGVSVGLEEETALRLVVQTFLGAAYLAKDSTESLASLRQMVTSPGGTTAAGLATFDKMGLKEMVASAIKAAWARSVELGKGV